MYALLLSILRMLRSISGELRAIRRELIAQGNIQLEQDVLLNKILAQVTPPPATHVEIELGKPQPQ